MLFVGGPRIVLIARPSRISLTRRAQCKYTSTPPYCNTVHIELPMKLKAKRAACPDAAKHPACSRLCETCSFVPDF